MTTGLQSWSQTAASNATADSAINFAEGMAPSAVNDSARALMASAAKYRDDYAGRIVTGGSSTAYTVTTNQTMTALVNSILAFVPHATNGATVTIAVDSIGAKPLRSAPGVELGDGVLVAGTPYTATYYTTNSGEWILHGFYGNPYGLGVGMGVIYLGSTAPTSIYALPFGQALSRTTYATLFALTGTAFGVGDGSTTFNIADIRGRAVFGQDNMGGSTASRITNAVSGIVGTTIGATGGSQSVALLQANLPAVNFTNSGIAGTISNGGQNATPLKSNGVSSGPGSASAQGSADGGTGSVVNSPSLTVDISSQGSAASGGSGTAVNKMPPGIILPYLIRII